MSHLHLPFPPSQFACEYDQPNRRVWPLRPWSWQTHQMRDRGGGSMSPAMLRPRFPLIFGYHPQWSCLRRNSKPTQSTNKLLLHHFQKSDMGKRKRHGPMESQSAPAWQLLGQVYLRVPNINVPAAHLPFKHSPFLTSQTLYLPYQPTRLPYNTSYTWQAAFSPSDTSPI